jgi:hypothetical protein
VVRELPSWILSVRHAVVCFTERVKELARRLSCMTAAEQIRRAVTALLLFKVNVTYGISATSAPET